MSCRDVLGGMELDILWKRYQHHCSTSVRKNYFEERDTPESRDEVYLSQIYAQIQQLTPDLPTDLQLLTDSSPDDVGQPLSGSYYGKTSSINSIVRKYLKVGLVATPSGCGRAFCAPDCISVNVQQTAPFNVGEILVGMSSGAKAYVVTVEGTYVFLKNIQPYGSFQSGEVVKGSSSSGQAIVTQDASKCPLSRVIRNVIPFEYGNGGYNYNLFRADGSRIFFGEGNWQLDTYAGVLTFYGGLPNGINEQSPPLLSIYRYVGKIGLNTSHSASGNVGIGTDNPLVSLDIRRQDAICLPCGSISQRPSPAVPGYIRYNVESDCVEAFTGCDWQDMMNGTGFGTEPVKIGTGGLDRQIAIGNATGDTGISLTAGTGNIGLRSNAGISLDANSNVNIQTRSTGGSSIVIGGNNNDLSIDLIASGSNSSINFVGPVNFSQANNINIQSSGGVYFDNADGKAIWRLIDIENTYDTLTTSLAVQKYDTISSTWLTRFRFD